MTNKIARLVVYHEVVDFEPELIETQDPNDSDIWTNNILTYSGCPVL